MEALVPGLMANSTLLTLHVAYNRITSAGLPAVVTVLTNNRTLVSLMLSSAYSSLDSRSV